MRINKKLINFNIPMATSFWTEENLQELVKLYPKTPLKKLEKKFKKHSDRIQQAYEFQVLHTRLHLKSDVENGIKITYYKPYDSHRVRENLYLPPIEYEDTDDKTTLVEVNI